MSAMWSQRDLTRARAALLFGVCGAVSSQFVNLEGWGLYVLPVPFGILAAWLCIGRLGPGVALVILDAAVWQPALRIPDWLSTNPIITRPTVLSVSLAGLVGGLGVSVATALCQRRLPTVRAVGMCAITGSVCGLPFLCWRPGVWWISVGGFTTPWWVWAIAVLCFSIWQAAVGVCLWHGFRLGKADRVT